MRPSDRVIGGKNALATERRRSFSSLASKKPSDNSHGCGTSPHTAGYSPALFPGRVFTQPRSGTAVHAAPCVPPVGVASGPSQMSLTRAADHPVIGVALTRAAASCLVISRSERPGHAALYRVGARLIRHASRGVRWQAFGQPSFEFFNVGRRHRGDRPSRRGERRT